MNVLFILISSLPHVSEHGISLDLIHEFKRNGHDVYIICALEKRENKETYLAIEDGCKILRVKIGNNKKANILEKGLTIIMLPRKYISAIKKYYSAIRFDLVLYPTPPVTQVRTVEFIKKRDGAKSYLLLKDIFPQNAVDIGMMSKSGIKGLPYKFFRQIEKKLYRISDYIGCMSAANKEYLLNHNSDIDPKRVEICPNSIEVIDKSVSAEEKMQIRKKYYIPTDKKVFIYGGNLGKPQGIPFLIECLKQCYTIDDVFFLIIGDGTEYCMLEDYIETSNQVNLKLMKCLTKADYDNMVGACDVGMIFLDHRFTIPNFPSRLLSYMQAKLPVLAVTDPNTDVGKVITEGGFGWWCESDNSDKVANMVANILKTPQEIIENMKEKAISFLQENYDVERSYEIIIKWME